MFQRNALQELRKWHHQKGRKPLIIRGARQVGKTTLVLQFSEQFDSFIHLNLELPVDRQPFESFTDIETLLQALFFLKNKSFQDREKTLLFIDEIQEVPEALNTLRYIYEQYPEIAVIAAGSMLESLFNKDVHFPVGRVSFLMLRPVSFPEFLSAIGEEEAVEKLKEIPIPAFTHERLLKLYHRYALIGGMPEVIARYAIENDITGLSPIYDSLLTSYLDDVEKYAANDSQVLHLRHVIRSAFALAGKRIKFAGLGNSEYRSREMAEALRIAEKALLLNLIHPITSATLPMLPDTGKSPRLQVLDTGLLNYFTGLQSDVLQSSDISSVHQGTIIEHLTGQELLAIQYESLSSLSFWTREKSTSTAEVDFIYLFEGKLIPVETKSGIEGRMRSLHLFMDIAPHNMAIRFYAGPLQITATQTTTGKNFTLLNLPYYLVSQIEPYLHWLKSQL